MKKTIVIFSILLILLSTGCRKKPTVKQTVKGNLLTYYEMSDGTWKCDDHIYKYRLELTGRMPNAAKETTFVWLSNLGEITFERSMKAAGLSSYSGDYFSPEEAVLVEME